MHINWDYIRKIVQKLTVKVSNTNKINQNCITCFEMKLNVI